MPRPKLSAADRAIGGAVGSVLAHGRRQRGLSSQDLSVSCGVSVDTIRSIETGRVASPGLFVVARMAFALGLSMDEVAWPIRTSIAGPGLDHPSGREPAQPATDDAAGSNVLSGSESSPAPTVTTGSGSKRKFAPRKSPQGNRKKARRS
jgi:transcriptional regulator with XRE-family HTH domain